MKKICGVICEFNPLHEGHIFLLNEAKRLGDAVVCVMSGNFVQRGECAVSDKYERSKAAAEAGADLVVELPFPWCAAPAEFFARAGVSIAASLGVTDLVFGSESGDIDAIKGASVLYDDPVFKAEFDKLYCDNTGYAEARYEAARITAPNLAGVFSSSNDALATEYVRQGRRISPDMEYHAVKRLHGVSSSEIRERMRVKHRLFDIERELFCLGKASKDSFDRESGILNRLENCAAEAADGLEMLSLAATKKYTDARLRRAALFAVTGTRKEELAAVPDFTVLLAANAKGREIVKGAAFEVVAKPADAKSAQYDAEAFADRLYTLCRMSGAPADEFLKKSPYIY